MPRNRHLRRSTLARSSLVLMLIASTLALALSAATPASASAPPAKSKGQGHLSQRLRALSTPELQAASSADRAAALSVAESGPGSLLSHAPGRVLVDIQFDLLTASRLDPVKATGARFVAANGPTHTATFDVAVDSISSLENLPGVKWIQEILTPLVNGTGGGGSDPGPIASSTCPQGIATTEGDAQLLASNARSTFSVDGTGVRVGVLSDSFAKASAPATTAAQDVTNGDLPGAANTCGYTTPVTVQSELTGTGADEGRGMSQLVHDLAPGSPLSFASAFNGEADFANQIVNLKNNGAKVIVDDVTYFDEPMYQDGIVAKAVQDVTDAGVPYFSSAANNNLIVSGNNVGSYEATGGYRPMACPAVLIASPYLETDCHDFDPSGGTDVGDLLTMPAGKQIRMTFGYNQPRFGVTTDLDIFLIDSVTGTVAASSFNDSIGGGITYESINYTNTTGVSRAFRLVVGRYTGAETPRFKVVFLTNGAAPFSAVQWNTSSGGDVIGPTTFGHNAKINAASVAAVPYNNSNTAETFTSRGPATYCWGPVVGVTPAAALPSCLTKQIDFAATDGGATSFFGSNVGGTWRFYGTSAAAPHAAAVGALLLQNKPCHTPSEVIAAIAASGRTVGSFGVADVGSGLIDAVAAMNALADCPPTLPAIAPITVNEGDVVTVNFPGAASQPAGHPLTYSFVQNTGPTVTYVQTTATTTRRFIAPRTTSNAAMPMTFTASVTDTTLGTTANQSVSVTVNNITPTASITAPTVVTAGGSVLLKGSSIDQIEPDIAPSGTTGRQYAWSQTGGTAVTLTPGSGAGFRQASFTPPSAGSYTFQLVVTDHGGTGAASAPATVTVVARSFPAAGTLNGVVVDETNAPLVGATVDVFANSTAGALVGSTTSGAGGAWTVGSLSAGTKYYVRFTAAGRGTRWNFDGFNTFYVRPVYAPNATVDAKLTLNASLRSISGTVQNSSAVGVSGVKVRLADETGWLSQATTAAGGTYSFSGLTAKGTYRLELANGDATFAVAWVTSDGRGSLSGATGSAALLVNTTSGNAVATTTTVYNKTTELRTLTVTVKDGSNNPITGTEVRVYNPGWTISQRTNASGVYTITGLRPGNLYQVWVWTKCVGCTSTSFTSQWANGVPGEQYDQSAKLADFVDITSNQSLTFTLS